MKRVYIDENGYIDDVSPQGMEAYLEKYEQMLANGATKEEAKAAATIVQEKMDFVCNGGFVP